MLSSLAINLFTELSKNKTIIAACDSGTKHNGKPDCIATYGITILHHDSIDTLIKFAAEWKANHQSGKKSNSTFQDSVEVYNYNGVVSKNIDAYGLECLSSLRKYKRDDGSEAKLSVFDFTEATPTISRGELTALNVLLDKISEECLDGNVIILSDSQYTINTVDTWSRKWFKDPAKSILCEKANLDLVASTQAKLDILRRERKVTLEHVRSHKKPPNIDTDPMDWIKWYVNDRADMLAGIKLSELKN